jgi:hypothetical protein
MAYRSGCAPNLEPPAFIQGNQPTGFPLAFADMPGSFDTLLTTPFPQPRSGYVEHRSSFFESYHLHRDPPC